MQSLIINQFITEEQCNQLIEMGKPQVKRSTNYHIKDGTESVDEHRTSEHMFLAKRSSPLVTTIEEMVARQTRTPLDNQEDIQIAHYVPGTFFKPHHNYFDPRYAGAAGALARGGSRIATFMIYLNNIPEGYGGETYFNRAGMSVKPDIGKACLWYNLYPDFTPDKSTELEGRTPKEPYEKWIATIWIRERTFT
jgi:prolyl 4-hydroxylase